MTDAPLAIWARRRLRSGNRPALAEKIILPGDRYRLGCVTQIQVRATCQRDEFSLFTSKFESDMPSRASFESREAQSIGRSRGVSTDGASWVTFADEAIRGGILWRFIVGAVIHSRVLQISRT